MKERFRNGEVKREETIWNGEVGREITLRRKELVAWEAVVSRKDSGGDVIVIEPME